MGNLQIKNLPVDMHLELRRRAAQREASVRDYVLDLIKADQEVPTTRDWLEAVADRPRAELPRGAVVNALDDVREDRDAERATSR